MIVSLLEKVRRCASLKDAMKMMLVALLLVGVAACGGAETPGAGDAEVKTNVAPVPDDEVAVIETDYGKIVMELYPNIAPKMVERFKTLVREGFYNGTTFHRVNPSAGVVQGGDPLSKDDDPFNDGTGGSNYPDVPAEFSDVPFEKGMVGAARAQDVNSANSQFYITLKRVPQWDGQYTVFGKVIEGMNNAQIIAEAPTRPGTQNPAEKITIKSITLQPRAK